MSFETKSVNEKNDAIVDLNSALNKAESTERIADITTALNTIIENGKFLKSSDGKEVELVNATDEDIKSLVDKLIPWSIDATWKDSHEVLKNNLIEALKKTREELKKVKDEKTIEQDKSDTENTAVRTELATDVMSGKWIYTSEQLKALKEKSWKELWTDPIYIKTIQQFIIDTGAKFSTISDDLLTNGIYGTGTIAGIKTIQTYLNGEYKSNLGTPDWLIWPNTLQELLKPVSDTDKRTRRDKMIDDHKADTLKLTPLDPINNHKKTEVEPSNKKWIDGDKKEKSLTNKEALKNPKKYNLKLELGSKTKLIPIEWYTWVDKDDKENFTVKVKDQNKISSNPKNKITNDEKNSISVEKLNKDIFQTIINKLNIKIKEKKLKFSINNNYNPSITISFYVDWKINQKKININQYYKNDNFDYEKIITELQQYEENERKISNRRKDIEKQIKEKIANKKFTKVELFWSRSNALIDTFFNNTGKNNELTLDGYSQNYTRLSLDGKSIIVWFNMYWIDSSKDRLIIPLKEVLTPNTTNINQNRLKANIRIYLEKRINEKYKS